MTQKGKFKTYSEMMEFFVNWEKNKNDDIWLSKNRHVYYQKYGEEFVEFYVFRLSHFNFSSELSLDDFNKSVLDFGQWQGWVKRGNLNQLWSEMFDTVRDACKKPG